MKTPSTKIARRLFTLTLSLMATCLFADPVLVGNPGLSTDPLDADTVKSVLLGKRVTIGSTRVVIVIGKDSPAQDTFLKKAIGMSSSQLQNHWRRLFMTGGGTAPKIVAADAVAATVADTPGAIGIVDDSQSKDLTVLTR